MSQMNGGRALIESLCQEGVAFVFGLPGAGQYEAVDAIYQMDDLEYINTRHEQATSYMADGYARISGEPGVALVVPGPGFYNTMAGLATSYAVSAPVLVITGAPHYNHGGFHAGTSLDLLGPICKWSGRANSPEEIPSVIQEAFTQLRSPRIRPVVVEIPTEALASISEVSTLPRASVVGVEADVDLISRAASILSGSKQPVIWVGNGASGSADTIALLAERLQAPVVSSRHGKGILSHRHPLCLGLMEPRCRPLNDWLDACDAILAIGVGASLESHAAGREVIQVDNDEESLNSNPSISLGILADASDAITGLLGQLGEDANSSCPALTETVSAINEFRYGPEEQLEPQRGFMDAIRAALPDDSVIVAGMNQMGYYSRNYFSAYQPTTYLTSSSHGNLGCVYPIALGAKVASPERAVLSVSGDGGFLYNSQEIATAVQYGINAVAVVFNDNAYGNVMRAQIDEFDGHVIGTKLHNPDFAAMAQSFGAVGVKATTPAELERAIRDGIEASLPTVIEVPVGELDRRY
jgi:acetolactate synthase I/II/III large subunit